MTPKKLQSMARVAGAIATRDFVELVERGLLVRRGAGRSTRYELALDGWERKPDQRVRKKNVNNSPQSWCVDFRLKRRHFEFLHKIKRAL